MLITVEPFANVIISKVSKSCVLAPRFHYNFFLESRVFNSLFLLCYKRSNSQNTI